MEYNNISLCFQKPLKLDLMHERKITSIIQNMMYILCPFVQISASDQYSWENVVSVVLAAHVRCSWNTAFFVLHENLLKGWYKYLKCIVAFGHFGFDLFQLITTDAFLPHLFYFCIFTLFYTLLVCAHLFKVKSSTSGLTHLLIL